MAFSNGKATSIKNQELKFTLEDNGDYNTYQLMPNASGHENKDNRRRRINLF